MASTSSRAYLSAGDYVVMAATLTISLAIGIYFACTGGRQRSQREYLTAEGKMSFLPVSLSLFASFQSAISLLGNPADAYVYGAMITYYGVSVALASAVTAFVIAPLFHPLRLVSVYQYLELRYSSTVVRQLGAVFGVFTMVIYMGFALLSPAIAIEAVTGIPIWMSLVVVAAIGTVYTAIGGIKSVLWTDVFQSVVIFAGLIAIIIKLCDQGYRDGEVPDLSLFRSTINFGKSLAQEIRLAQFSPDPRVRHTLWGFLSGYAVYFLGPSLTQSSVLRISSTKSLQHAKWSFLAAALVNLLYSTCLAVAGLCMYAYFTHIGCDPLQAKRVSSSNQLIIYFAVNVLGFIPGVSGLFLAAILSGSLSTLSSGLNSLAANTVEDFLRHPLAKLPSACDTTFTKVCVFLYGCAIIGIAYAMQSLEGPMTQLTVSALGACTGPMSGLFLLGAVFPQANKVGAVAGVVTGMAVNVWIAIGGFLYGACKPRKPPGPVRGCSSDNNSSAISLITTHPPTASSEAFGFTANKSNINNKLGCDGTGRFFLYDLSYIWYALCGCLVCMTVGLAVSWIANFFMPRLQPPSEFLVPQVRRFVTSKHSEKKKPEDHVYMETKTQRFDCVHAE